LSRCLPRNAPLFFYVRDFAKMREIKGEYSLEILPFFLEKDHQVSKKEKEKETFFFVTF
jgi:hypothetical protein